MDDIQKSIINKLPIRDRFNAMAVCTDWREYVHTASCWIDIVHLHCRFLIESDTITLQYHNVWSDKLNDHNVDYVMQNDNSNVEKIIDTFFYAAQFAKSVELVRHYVTEKEELSGLHLYFSRKIRSVPWRFLIFKCYDIETKDDSRDYCIDMINDIMINRKAFTVSRPRTILIERYKVCSEHPSFYQETHTLIRTLNSLNADYIIFNYSSNFTRKNVNKLVTKLVSNTDDLQSLAIEHKKNVKCRYSQLDFNAFVLITILPSDSDTEITFESYDCYELDRFSFPEIEALNNLSLMIHEFR